MIAEGEVPPEGPEEFPGYRCVGALEPLADVRRVLATDQGLERAVEIHTLLPGAATPGRLARFLGTAGLLARMNHPNVAPVHRIGEGSASPAYYIVPHLTGDTLASRTAAGPLAPPEWARLADDLLGALAAAHAAGATGGELDPASIARVDGRWVLTGLGVARCAGISRWVAPEEHGGGEAAAAGDLYLAGLLLRDARGRMPARIRAIIERALAPAPADRWADAASFRSACRAAVRRRRWRPALSLPILGVAAVLVAWTLGLPPFRRAPARPAYRLAVLPFVAGGEDPDSVAGSMAGLLQLALDGTPGVSLASSRQVLKRLGTDDQGNVLAPETVGRALIRALRAEWVAQGRVDRQGPAVLLAITLYDWNGNPRPLPEVRGSPAALSALSDSLARQLLGEIAPQRMAQFVPRPEVRDVPLPALKAFLRGEEAFGRDQHSRAERYFKAAVDADSSFALAAWRLANVRRWRRLPVGVDLGELYRRYGGRLGDTDRRLLEALLEPDLRRRFTMLEGVVAADPDAYARLIYGEELWHRGPLIGIDVAEATRTMGAAVAADSALAQAYDHIIMYYIREGDEARAWQAYEEKLRVSPPPSPGDPDTPRFFRLALLERFHPWEVALAHVRLRMRHDSSDIAGLAKVARLGGPWFDIPESEVVLSRILLRYGPADDSARGSARVGIALGQLAQGRVARGLAELDTAAAALRSPELRLQQAEWRVIPPALGLRGWLDDAKPWIGRLEGMAGDSALAPRARFAAAIGELGAGDTAAFLRRTAAAPDSTAPLAAPLATLLRAIRAGVLGRPDEALAIADAVAPAFEVTEPPDPFADAALHLFRGDWQRARGDDRAADGEWLWYQAAEFDGWPSAAPQAGEVDGVLGVFARWKRAELRLATATGAADSAAACALVRRVAELWKDADASLAPVHAAILTHAGGCRS